MRLQTATTVKPLTKIVVVALLLLVGIGVVPSAYAIYTTISGTVSVDEPYGNNRLLTASDGSFVVFTSSTPNGDSTLTTLYRANTTSDTPQRLVSGITNFGTMLLTPDNRYVLYTEGTDASLYYLWRVDVETGERLLLDEGFQLGGGIGFPYLFQISADSQYAVYARSTEPFSPYREIAAAPIAGGPSVELTKADVPEGVVYEIQISPDSRHLLYLWQVGDYNNNLLISVPLTGGDGVILNPTGVRPLEQSYLFTPDGESVLFEGGVQPTRLYRASLAEGNALPLTDPYYWLLLEDVTPDGQYAIISIGETETSQDTSLLRVRIDNGDTTTLDRRTGSIRLVKLAPQGDYLAYAMQFSSEPTQLFSVNWREPGESVRIGTDMGYTGICGCPTFEFASDGVYVVYPRTSSQNPSVLLSTPVDGSTPEETLYPGYSVGGYLISEDGSRVFFTTLPGERETILSVPIDGGDTTTLYQDESDPGAKGLYEALPNNRILVYLRGEEQNSLLVVDDTIPTVQFVADTQWVAEGDGTVTIPVTLNGASVEPTTVEVAVTGGTATAGEDYTFAPQTLTFAPGVTTQTATLTMVADEAADSGETITFELTNATGGTLGTPTILTVTLYDTLYRVYMPAVAH